jgi:uncharacterized RDD family membrane protein YckC
VPTMCCSSCGGRRDIVDYLARLPLRCTGCGRGLVPESEAMNALMATLATPPATNGAPAPDAIPSLVYVGLSTAELSEPQISVDPPAPPSESVEPLEPASLPEFTPSQTEISILPDPELAPLVVSEKFSGSTFQLPPATPEESNKSKLAERLKEIASLPAIDLDPVPPEPEPRMPFATASPGRRFAARGVAVGLGALAYFAGIGWMFALSRAGVVGTGTPPYLSSALYFVPLALYLAIHALLLATRGQDVGKILLGLRIRLDDGAPATAREALWLRELPIPAMALALVPIGLAVAYFAAIDARVAGVVAVLVIPALDALMVFSRRGRCLHDRLAGTVVVQS